MPESTATPDAPSRDEIEALLGTLAVGPESNLIGVLQDVQARFGWLPPQALEAVSRRTRVPLARVWGVVSFYTQFYTEPRGRHTVRCCTGTACHVKGGRRVLDAVIQTLGIREGGTTPDMTFCLETVACLGTCFLAPVMMIDDQYYGNLDVGKIESILDSCRNAS